MNDNLTGVDHFLERLGRYRDRLLERARDAGLVHNRPDLGLALYHAAQIINYDLTGKWIETKALKSVRGTKPARKRMAK